MRRILKYGPYSRVKFSHGQCVLADLRAVRCKLQLLIWVLLPVLAGAAAPSFETRECTPAVAAAGARCGVVHVPENPAKPRARQIGLKVIVLPATGATDHKRAQYDLEGGPGFAATDFLDFYAGEGAAYRVGRDIVLADLRGTGGSNPLRCFGIEEYQKRAPAPMYPPELVAECARQSSVADDPRQYTTAAAAQDIELIRRALGYEQLDLNAISYGTTLALRYMAEYPARVHAAALMGTVPASATPPRMHAIAADQSLAKLADACRASDDCTQKFGDVDANLRAAQLPDVFMEKLRGWLYAPATRARVPALLQLAARGDFRAFTAPSQGRVFADGLYLSITCAESFPEMDVDAAMAAARDTRFGAYRLERQRAACGSWPKAGRDRKLMRSKSSPLPVLFISGELDAVSPIAWTTELAHQFPSGRVAVAPQGGHVFDGLTGLESCLDATIIRLFDTGDARALDTSCFADMKPPAFEAVP